MDLFSSVPLAEVIGTIVYTGIGVLLLAACWWIINRLAPFPVIKEIEHDQNVALAILIGAVFVSISIIIAAVILS